MTQVQDIEQNKNESQIRLKNQKKQCMILNQTIKLNLISFSDHENFDLLGTILSHSSPNTVKKLWIELNGNGSFSQGFKIFSEQDLSNIQHFWCMNSQDSKIGSREIEYFVKNSWPKLSNLYLFDQRIGDYGLLLILRKNWRELKQINLANNMITSIGLKEIPSWKAIHLSNLKLSENNIGSKGIKLLIKSSLPQLKQLNLTKCNIGNEGAKHISKGKWPKFIQLGLYGNSIQQNIADVLFSNNWGSVKKIQSGSVDSIFSMAIVASCWKGRIRVENQVVNRELKKQYKKITDARFA